MLILLFVYLSKTKIDCNTHLTIKWREDLVDNFFMKKEGNAKCSSAVWSIADILHGEIGRKITSFYSQMGINDSINFQWGDQ